MRKRGETRKTLTNQPTNTPTLLEAYSLLSRSESRVLKKIAEGKTNKQIASELFRRQIMLENHHSNVTETGEVEPSHMRQTALFALNILKRDLREICSVGEWSKRACCTPCWLGQCLKECCGVGSREMLRAERCKQICSVMRKNPNLRADRLADRVNHAWNGRHLCDFLRRNYKTNFTNLKAALMEEETETSHNK